MSLTFRLTQMEDAPYLTRWLSNEETLRGFPMCNDREIEDAVRIWISYSKLEAGITALWNGEPCGIATLYIQPYKKLAHTCLFSIIVQEELRSQGVGRALLQKLIEHAQEKFHIEILHLEVYDGNPARHLYERMGFTTFGKQTRFLKEQGKYSAKILMQKKL